MLSTRVARTAPRRPLRIVIVDAQPMFRAALCWTLSRLSPDAEILEAGRLSDAIALMRHEPPSLVLLDDDLPDCDSIEALKTLNAQFPALPVALLANDASRPASRRALACGASGYLSKSASLEEMSAALHELTERASKAQPTSLYVVAGAPNPDTNGLTPAQARVLSLVEKGQLNKQIAHEMGITESTVKAHVSAIFRKLRVQNRVQAIIAASRLQEGFGAVA